MLQACENLTKSAPKLTQGDYGDLVKALKKVSHLSLKSYLCMNAIHCRDENIPRVLRLPNFWSFKGPFV